MSDEKRMYFAYILRCGDSSYYCGYTVDLAARLATHNAGLGGKYTRSRRPLALVYYESFVTKSEAMRREAALKKLSRTQKTALIFGTFPNGVEI